MSMPHRTPREGVSVSSPQQWDRQSQHNQPRTNKHNGTQDEVVFRRARAILNKLTIEKFDSLVNQLLGVGITNENVLRGIILLLFEKALDEPNYSSMYAQVCLRLSQDAPNFEPPDVKTGKPRQPATFIKLLLSKCKNEFENRSRACELAADAAQKIQSIDNPADRHLQEMHSNADVLSARRKMIGNIKFIGELGKLQLLSEKILHDCIKQLVSKVHDPNPEDVECLCKLLNTVGAQLDHERAKPFMDKYFSRMQEMLKEDLPSRIKFMIQDVIDLRGSDWIPRRLTEEEGPKSINAIRIDAFKEQAMKSAGRGRRQAEQSMRALQMQQFGIQGQFPFQEPQRDRGIPSMPGGFQGMTRGDALLPDFLGNKGNDQQPTGNQKKNNQQYNSQRARVGQFTKTPKEPGEINLRPAKSFTFNQAQPQSHNKMQSVTIPNPQQVFPTLPNVLVKKKKEGKGNKKPSKQQMQKSSIALLEEYFHGDDLAEAIQCIKEQLTRNYHSTFVATAYNTALEKKEEVQAKLIPLFVECTTTGLISNDAVLQGTEEILKSMDDLALDIPKIPLYMGHIVAAGIKEGLFTLKETTALFLSGDNTNVYLHVLAKLAELWGQEKLFEVFHKEKLDILKVLPKEKRTAEYKVQVVRDSNLTFLYPYLKVTDVIQEQLAKHFPLQRSSVEDGAVHPGVRAMFSHFKETFSSEIRHNRKFGYEVARGSFKHISELTTLKDTEEPATKESKEAEKALMSDLSSLLAQYCKTIDGQTDTLYALQVFCHDSKFPKGLMLRMAMYLYDMDVVEEEAFMKWRDEINDDYPGKGEALIAVNEYLNWMKSAEYDESEESEDDLDVSTTA